MAQETPGETEGNISEGVSLGRTRDWEKALPPGAKRTCGAVDKGDVPVSVFAVPFDPERGRGHS